MRPANVATRTSVNATYETSLPVTPVKTFLYKTDLNFYRLDWNITRLAKFIINPFKNTIANIY